MEPAVTIREAATWLGVTRQRISQLLTAGDLEGPMQQEVVRAPRNAARVFVSSLEALKASRAAGRNRSRRPHPAVGEPVLRDDAFRMKIALDVARDQLAKQRLQNQQLTSLLAEAVHALQAEQAMARETDQITEAYATIATNHLAPDGPGDDF